MSWYDNDIAEFTIVYTSLPIIAHTGCMDSTSSTTVMIFKPIPASSGLSGEHSCEYHTHTYIIVANNDEIVFIIILYRW